MRTPSADSPQFRVIQNGLGEWILESLDNTLGGTYYYRVLKVFMDRESAIEALARRKRDAEERADQATKRRQIIEEIY